MAASARPRQPGLRRNMSGPVTLLFVAVVAALGITMAPASPAAAASGCGFPGVEGRTFSGITDIGPMICSDWYIFAGVELDGQPFSENLVNDQGYRYDPSDYEGEPGDAFLDLRDVSDGPHTFSVSSYDYVSPTTTTAYAISVNNSLAPAVFTNVTTGNELADGDRLYGSVTIGVTQPLTLTSQRVEAITLTIEGGHYSVRDTVAPFNFQVDADQLRDGAYTVRARVELSDSRTVDQRRTVIIETHRTALYLDTPGADVIAGRPVTATGLLFDITDQVPLGGRDVIVHTGASNGPRVAAVRTRNDGTFTYKWTPKASGRLTFTYAGESGIDDSVSGPFDVRLASSISLTVDRRMAPVGEPIRLTARTQPPIAGIRVQLSAWDGHRWHSYEATMTRPGGTVTGNLTSHRPGTWRFRFMVLPKQGFAPSESNGVTLTWR